jgi:exodeoxyribonuclease VII small subunit
MNKEKTLQSNFQALEDLAKELEGGNLDIEESMTKFKEGVSLIKECQKQLKEAKNEFVKLSEELDKE